MSSYGSGLSPALRRKLPLIQLYAKQHGIPLSYAINQAVAEDASGDPNAISSTGAVGQYQLEPSTAAGLGVNPWIDQQNIEGGLRDDQTLYQQFGSWREAFAAYNWGGGRVQALRQRYGPSYSQIQSHIPQSVQSYVSQVTGGNGPTALQRKRFGIIQGGKGSGGSGGSSPIASSGKGAANLVRAMNKIENPKGGFFGLTSPGAVAQGIIFKAAFVLLSFLLFYIAFMTIMHGAFQTVAGDVGGFIGGGGE